MSRGPEQHLVPQYMLGLDQLQTQSLVLGFIVELSHAHPEELLERAVTDITIPRPDQPKHWRTWLVVNVSQ